MKKFGWQSVVLICFIFIVSLALNFLVFKKSVPNFPIILRTNDFGTNFVANRHIIWQIPILGLVFMGINFLLYRLFQKTSQNLSKLIVFANIGIVVLMFIISLQIYFLNR